MIQKTPLILQESLKTGSTFGRYKLLGVSGEKGSGRRYVAEHCELKSISRTVSLKLLDPDITQRPDFRTRLLEASRLVNQLEHTNIGAIYEMDNVDGAYFMSMEYIPGESLQTILAKCGSRLPVEIAAWITLQAANGLHYYHGLRADAGPDGQLHGEINPSNLFVTYHGTVKLQGFDLGSIRRRSTPAQGVLAPESSQRLSYRAPEQIEHESVDPRADIFSLGVILWSCLTGRKLFSGPTEADADAAVSSQPIASPRSVRSQIPLALEHIAMRALSRDRQQRFQSASELSDALGHYLRRCGPQPTPKLVRRWMLELFGMERSSLHLEISQGREVESALQSLHSSPLSGIGRRRIGACPRELWSTSQHQFSRLEHGLGQVPRLGERTSSIPPLQVSPLISTSLVVATPPPALPSSTPTLTISSTAPRPSRRTLWGVVAATGATSLVIAVVAAFGFSSSSDHAALRAPGVNSVGLQRRGQIIVHSTPAGALVFVDGEPTGQRTPALLKGIVGDRRLEIRVDKAGFQSQRKTLTKEGASVQTVSFVLGASEGVVRFVGVPPNARIYVDDIAITEGWDQPVPLSVGRHAIRVELLGTLLFSATVPVVAGEQIVRMSDIEEQQ